MPERVSIFVDGFNLYYGMRSAGFRRFYWLNFRKLADNLLRSNQELVAVKYFTARISGTMPGATANVNARMQAKSQRQSVFLAAVDALDKVSILYGHYNTNKTAQCRQCNNQWATPEEKMTDVQIATHMIVDAFQDEFDTGIVISGDSDLVPPVRAIRQSLPQKKILAFFPPRKVSTHLRQSCNAHSNLTRSHFARSQLDNPFTLQDGRVLHCPTEWS